MLATRLRAAGAARTGGFPKEPTEYILIKTVSASGDWVAPENGYFEIELQGASGTGGWSYKDPWFDESDNFAYHTGGGGGGGGCARSRVMLMKGDIVKLTLGATNANSSATISSTVEGKSYSVMSVTSGKKGEDSATAEYDMRPYSGGAGGVGSGGNVGNYTGGTGIDGYFGAHNGAFSVNGASGGAAGYTGGNEGGASGSIASKATTGVHYGAAGKAGFCKIYRGNTNVVERPTATASTSPTDGVTYTDGLADLDAETLPLFSQAISENGDITRDTTVVYVDSSELHRKISVGDQISLSLNGTAYAFDVIGFNHDSLTDPTAYGLPTATGRAGITFQMHGCFADTYTMNASQTNAGGWKDSAMRTTTMPLMKGYLPSDWQSIIKSVEKSTGLGGGSTEGTEITSDELFVLSEVEVFGKITNSVYGEGYQYAYYKKGNETIKLLPNKTAREWSERSPEKTTGLYFCRIGKDGTAGKAFGNALSGLAFGFCI